MTASCVPLRGGGSRNIVVPVRRRLPGCAGRRSQSCKLPLRIDPGEKERWLFNPDTRLSLFYPLNSFSVAAFATNSVNMRPFTPQGLRPLRSFLSQSIRSTTSRTPSLRLFSSQIAHSPLFTYNSVTSHSRRIVTPTFRQKSTSSRPLTKEPSDRIESDADRQKRNEERRRSEEAYQIHFTCKPCGERSSHRMSKQGYHRGTVLIQCPSCDNRHVMSDHLGIFFDKRTTLEDLLKERGQTLTHGHTDGNLEFWEDGTVKSFGLDGTQLLDSSDQKSS